MNYPHTLDDDKKMDDEMMGSPYGWHPNTNMHDKKYLRN